LLLGALAPHDADADSAGVSPWQEVAQTTTHPDVPEHLEAPAVKSHSGCTACLVQLESQSLAGPSQRTVAFLPRGEACVANPAGLLLSSPRRLAPARAPPAPLLLSA
jgi:hypothetical protein